MASIATQKNGRRYIQLSPGENRKRPKVHLGKVTKREAESVRVHVETLIRARTTGTPAPMATADWLVNAPDALRARLVELGLVDAAETVETPRLAAFVAKYIESRGDLSKNSLVNYRQTEREIAQHFGPTVRLGEVNAGHAEDFATAMRSRGLAEVTVGRHLRRVKQFFAVAVRREIIDKSPFRHMTTSSAHDRSRMYFVTREEIAAVIDACPDSDWRAIFALARYGGLRVPSEILPLTWADVNFEKKTLLVTSDKTKRHGKGKRSVPLFPELAAILLDAFEQAETGAEHIISRYRDPKQNLRTTAHKIIERAGIAPWPKCFVNLRSSRETELAETYPIHVVTSWLGNSPAVAAKHYLQVTGEHFRQAVQAVHNPVQTAHEPAGRALQAFPGNPRNRTQNKGLQDASKSRKPLLCKPLHRPGLEPGTR
jgi:integrase